MQSGQQPDPATVVAAIAAVPNTASNTPITPITFAFIGLPLDSAGRPIRAVDSTVSVQADLNVKGLDLQVGLKVLPYSMQIGDAAKRAGISPPTIRYYEEIGLLPKPSRSGAGYRCYTDSTVEELQFIRKAQAIGFSLDEIRQILQLSRAGRKPCGHVLTLAHQHLTALDERIRRLQKFRKQLAADLAKWDEQKTATTCSGLCQWIAETDLTAEDVSVRRTRKG